MLTAKEAIELMEKDQLGRIEEGLQRVEDGIKKATRLGFNSYFWNMKPQDNDVDHIKNKLIERGFSVHETLDSDGDVDLVVSWVVTDRIKKKIEIDQLRYTNKINNPAGGIARLLGA